MWRALVAALLLAGCATIDRVEDRLGFGDEDGRPAQDSALAGSWRPRRARARRTHAAERPSRSVRAAAWRDSEEIALTPLASDPSRAVRMRRPHDRTGRRDAWHAHGRDARHGADRIRRGDRDPQHCMDRSRYRAGDVANRRRADSARLANDGDVPAVVMVAHVVTRD